MTARVQTRTEARVEAGQETAKFAVGAMGAAALLIGLWAAACLIGGLATNGIGGMVRGFITAVTGA